MKTIRATRRASHGRARPAERRWNPSSVRAGTVVRIDPQTSPGVEATRPLTGLANPLALHPEMSTIRLVVQIAALVGLACATPVKAQRTLTPNTLGVEDGAARPAASLADVAWLVGHWRGEALGGTVDEVWSSPRGDAMMGMFRLAHGDSVVFYELLTLVESEGSLSLRLKHFNADLTGWEKQDEVRVFPLVRRTPEAMYFHGMTFRPLGDDSLRIDLAMGQPGGTMREEQFLYKRIRSR